MTASSASILPLALGIGLVAGLRSLTAPAAVSWALVLSVLALGEYVADVLPGTPNRTKPGPLVARIVMGGLAGACISVSAGHSWLAGAVPGAMGGVIGAFAGYEVRRRVVSGAKVKDAVVGVTEDLVAIGLAYALLVSVEM